MFNNFLIRGKRFSGDYDLPALPSSRFEPVPCFQHQIPVQDPDDIFPSGVSPTFEKALTWEKTIEDAKFIAQHVKNKDKFENVSITLKVTHKEINEVSILNH